MLQSVGTSMLARHATILSLVFLFHLLPAFSGEQPTLIFPQIVKGGGFVMEIILTNPTVQEESGTIFFKDDEGQAWWVKLNTVTTRRSTRPLSSFGFSTLAACLRNH